MQKYTVCSAKISGVRCNNLRSGIITKNHTADFNKISLHRAKSPWVSLGGSLGEAQGMASWGVAYPTLTLGNPTLPWGALRNLQGTLHHPQNTLRCKGILYVSPGYPYVTPGGPCNTLSIPNASPVALYATPRPPKASPGYPLIPLKKPNCRQGGLFLKNPGGASAGSKLYSVSCSVASPNN